MSTTIKPYIDADILPLLKNKKRLIALKNLHEGPVHIIFPHIMNKNINRFKEIFSELGLQVKIHYAHKTNKSITFLQEAYKAGINIDVASKSELVNALSAGFTGKMISCTGPKNTSFLRLAIQHDCLISLDCLSELEEIVEISTIYQNKKVNILIRLNNFELKDRNVSTYISKFGITQDQLTQCYSIIRSNKQIVLKGFQLHRDEKTSEIKSRYIENLISIMEDALQQGFPVEILNTGGGYRELEIAQYQDWQSYIENIQAKMLNNEPTNTWMNFNYGMNLNEAHKVSGSEKAKARIKNIKDRALLVESFNNDEIRGRKLADIVRDFGFSVMIEPGYALVQHAGVTIVSILSVKQIANGDCLIVLNANALNFSWHMPEMVADPVLIAKEENNVEFEGYIVGNLCRETDIIMKRKICFPTTPQVGDLLVFINTAGYTSDFEDATPIQHPAGKKFVAIPNDNEFDISSEENYLA